MPSPAAEIKNCRVSEMGLQDDLAKEVRTEDGLLDVNRALSGLSETRKSNKSLIKLLLIGGISIIVLVGAVTGVSYAVTLFTRQVVVDSSTGLATTCDGSTIIKTAPAITRMNGKMIHEYTLHELSKLTQILYGDEISFVVHGYARKKNETILLVKGGTFSFDSGGIKNVTGDNILLMMGGNDDSDHRKLDQALGGGLQEWSTDQDLDEAARRDANAMAAAKRAAEQDNCIPVDEGENCW